MKNLLFILLLISIDDNKITKVSSANKAKENAEVSYKNGDYKNAIKNYHYLLDSLKIDNSNARINLAHSYLLSKDTSNAQTHYNNLTNSVDKNIASIAHQQLGAISYKKNDLNTALSHFKNALKANPNNEEARYNYELTKKKLENQNKENQQNKNSEEQKQQEQKDQENKDSESQKNNNQDKDKQQKDGEKDEKSSEEKNGKDGEQKKEESEKEGNKNLEEQEQKQKEEEAKNKRFEEIKMNEENAKMILDAMKQSEKQYLQQLQKTPQKKKDSSLPDW